MNKTEKIIIMRTSFTADQMHIDGVNPMSQALRYLHAFTHVYLHATAARMLYNMREPNADEALCCFLAVMALFASIAFSGIYCGH